VSARSSALAVSVLAAKQSVHAAGIGRRRRDHPTPVFARMSPHELGTAPRRNQLVQYMPEVRSPTDRGARLGSESVQATAQSGVCSGIDEAILKTPRRKLLVG